MTDMGYYYLHENGDLIWKKFEPEQESGGFVRQVWDMGTHAATRKEFIDFLKSARKAGANEARILELATKNGILPNEITTT